MKHYAVLTDTVRDEPFGFVIKDGNYNICYGLHSAANEWADLYNSGESKTLEEHLPSEIIVSPFGPLSDSTKTFLDGAVDGTTKDIPTPSMMRRADSQWLRNESTGPRLKDRRLDQIDHTMRQVAIDYKTRAFVADAKRSSMLLKARLTNAGFNPRFTGFRSKSANEYTYADIAGGNSGMRRAAKELHETKSQLLLHRESFYDAVEVKALGARLGGRGGRAARRLTRAAEAFNPDAVDADLDMLVQEGTAFERPALPRKPRVLQAFDGSGRPEVQAEQARRANIPGSPTREGRDGLRSFREFDRSVRENARYGTPEGDRERRETHEEYKRLVQFLMDDSQERADLMARLYPERSPEDLHDYYKVLSREEAVEELRRLGNNARVLGTGPGTPLGELRKRTAEKHRSRFGAGGAGYGLHSQKRNDRDNNLDVFDDILRDMDAAIRDSDDSKLEEIGEELDALSGLYSGKFGYGFGGEGNINPDWDIRDPEDPRDWHESELGPGGDAVGKIHTDNVNMEIVPAGDVMDGEEGWMVVGEYRDIDGALGNEVGYLYDLDVFETPEEAAAWVDSLDRSIDDDVGYDDWVPPGGTPPDPEPTDGLITRFAEPLGLGSRRENDEHIVNASHELSSHIAGDEKDRDEIGRLSGELREAVQGSRDISSQPNRRDGAREDYREGLASARAVPGRREGREDHQQAETDGAKRNDMSVPEYRKWREDRAAGRQEEEEMDDGVAPGTYDPPTRRQIRERDREALQQGAEREGVSIREYRAIREEREKDRLDLHWDDEDNSGLEEGQEGFARAGVASRRAVPGRRQGREDREQREIEMAERHEMSIPEYRKWKKDRQQWRQEEAELDDAVPAGTYDPLTRKQTRARDREALRQGAKREGVSIREYRALREERERANLDLHWDDEDNSGLLPGQEGFARAGVASRRAVPGRRQGREDREQREIEMAERHEMSIPEYRKWKKDRQQWRQEEAELDDAVPAGTYDPLTRKQIRERDREALRQGAEREGVSIREYRALREERERANLDLHWDDEDNSGLLPGQEGFARAGVASRRAVPGRREGREDHQQAETDGAKRNDMSVPEYRKWREDRAAGRQEEEEMDDGVAPGTYDPPTRRQIRERDREALQQGAKREDVSIREYRAIREEREKDRLDLHWDDEDNSGLEEGQEGFARAGLASQRDPGMDINMDWDIRDPDDRKDWHESEMGPGRDAVGKIQTDNVNVEIVSESDIMGEGEGFMVSGYYRDIDGVRGNEAEWLYDLEIFDTPEEAAAWVDSLDRSIDNDVGYDDWNPPERDLAPGATRVLPTPERGGLATGKQPSRRGGGNVSKKGRGPKPALSDQDYFKALKKLSPKKVRELAKEAGVDVSEIDHRQLMRTLSAGRPRPAIPNVPNSKIYVKPRSAPGTPVGGTRSRTRTAVMDRTAMPQGLAARKRSQVGRGLYKPDPIPGTADGHAYDQLTPEQQALVPEAMSERANWIWQNALGSGVKKNDWFERFLRELQRGEEGVPARGETRTGITRPVHEIDRDTFQIETELELAMLERFVNQYKLYDKLGEGKATPETVAQRQKQLRQSLDFLRTEFAMRQSGNYRSLEHLHHKDFVGSSRSKTPHSVLQRMRARDSTVPHAKKLLSPETYSQGKRFGPDGSPLLDDDGTEVVSSTPTHVSTAFGFGGGLTARGFAQERGRTTRRGRRKYRADQKLQELAEGGIFEEGSRRKARRARKLAREGRGFAPGEIFKPGDRIPFRDRVRMAKRRLRSKFVGAPGAQKRAEKIEDNRKNVALLRLTDEAATAAGLADALVHGGGARRDFPEFEEADRRRPAVTDRFISTLAALAARRRKLLAGEKKDAESKKVDDATLFSAGHVTPAMQLTADMYQNLGFTGLPVVVNEAGMADVLTDPDVIVIQRGMAGIRPDAADTKRARDQYVPHFLHDDQRVVGGGGGAGHGSGEDWGLILEPASPGSGSKPNLSGNYGDGVMAVIDPKVARIVDQSTIIDIKDEHRAIDRVIKGMVADSVEGDNIRDVLAKTPPDEVVREIRSRLDRAQADRKLTHPNRRAGRVRDRDQTQSHFIKPHSELDGAGSGTTPIETPWRDTEMGSIIDDVLTHLEANPEQAEDVGNVLELLSHMSQLDDQDTFSYLPILGIDAIHRHSGVIKVANRGALIAYEKPVGLKETIDLVEKVSPGHTLDQHRRNKKRPDLNKPLQISQIAAGVTY